MPDTSARDPSGRAPRRRRVRRVAGLVVLALLAVLLVPYGHDHANPTPRKQVQLASTGQRDLFRAACQDCHSDQTQWLWYTNVAPVSWLVQSDVTGGREHLNVSAWDQPQADLGEVVEQIDSGEMPPLKYWISPYHWNARLSDTDKRELIAGFRQLYAAHPPSGGG